MCAPIRNRIVDSAIPSVSLDFWGLLCCAGVYRLSFFVVKVVKASRKPAISTSDNVSYVRSRVRNLRGRAEKKGKPMKDRFICGIKVKEKEDGTFERARACRPKGSGKYGEPTVQMRIPCSLVPFVETLLQKMADIQTTKRVIEANTNNTTWRGVK